MNAASPGYQRSAKLSAELRRAGELPRPFAPARDFRTTMRYWSGGVTTTGRVELPGRSHWPRVPASFPRSAGSALPVVGPIESSHGLYRSQAEEWPAVVRRDQELFPFDKDEKITESNGQR